MNGFFKALLAAERLDELNEVVIGLSEYSNMHFLHIAFFVGLSVIKDVANMP